MAVIRELTTIIDFKIDEAGLSKTEQAVSQIKSSLVSLGKLFGIVFAAEKVYEWVDELFSAGKEIAKLTYQLNRMAREGDNIPEAMNELFGIAQNTGVEYTHVLDVYKEMLNESRELNTSQDQLLMTVSNIYKGLRLGAASSEEISQTFESLNRGFRMGRIGRRQFGLLNDIAPEVTKALARSLYPNEKNPSEKLEELAKAGKLTANVLINGLGKAIKSLDEDFANRPRKLAEAFTIAWNEATKLSAAIWKAVNTTGMVANAIVYMVKSASAGFKSLLNYVGGLKKLLELLAITVAVATGPAFVRALQLAVVWTTRLIARNLILIAQYAALAIAVLGVVLIIQDLMVWMRGGGSVIGDMLGPFKDFQDNFVKMFDSANFFAPFKAFQNFVEGDFVGAWEKVKQSLRDVDGLLGIIGISLAAIIVGFRLWNTLKFFGLIEALGFVAKGIRAISIAAGVALADLLKIARARLLLAGGAIGSAILVGLYGKEVLQGLTDKVLGRDPNQADADRSGASAAGSKQFWGLFKYFNPMNWVSPGQVAPSSLPGSLEGGINTGNNTVNQTNNVTIQVDPAAGSVIDEIRAGASKLFDDWGRQARNAVPTVEMPKQ